jgi:cytochrome P450
MFGFSPNDDEWRAIERCHGVVDSRHTVSGQPADHAAIAELEEIVGKHLRDPESGPSAMTVLRERDHGAADDITLVRNLIFLAWSSSADTTGLLVWILKRLTDEPIWLDRLRDASGTPTAVDLADRIVAETLRLGQSEMLTRKITAPVTIGGHTVPSGWHLNVGLREAHRDAEVFDDPDSFDPARFTRRRFGRLEYAPFGLDHHQCVGEALVRTTARLFVLALADGYRCAGLDDGPDQISAWRHWHPNAEWRLMLDPIRSNDVTVATASIR